MTTPTFVAVVHFANFLNVSFAKSLPLSKFDLCFILEDFSDKTQKTTWFLQNTQQHMQMTSTNGMNRHEILNDRAK